MAAAPGPAPQVSIIALAGGQGPWLLDWVIWHRLAGFSRVILCHPPGDGAADLLAALARLGLATGVPVAPGTDTGTGTDRPAQVRAAVNSPAARAALAGSDWLLVAEVTDFLHAPAPLLPHITALTDASGLALPAITFGTGGQGHYASRPVPARFIHRQAAGSVQRVPLRVLARYRADWTWGLHRPALPKGEVTQWLTPAGSCVSSDHLTWFLRPEDAGFSADSSCAELSSSDVSSAALSFADLSSTDRGDTLSPRINRYPLRSAEEFLLSRPAPLSPADLAEFTRLNNTPVPDTSAAPHARATLQAVTTALQDPALRAAQARQSAALRTRLAAQRARPRFADDLRALLHAMSRDTQPDPLWPPQAGTM